MATSTGAATFTGTASPLASLWSDLPDPSTRPLPYFLTTFLAILLLYSLQGNKSSNKSLTHLNPRKPFALTDLGPKQLYYFNCGDLVSKWFGANPDKPARMITSDVGELILLPPHLANEVRNDPRFTFADYISSVCFSCLGVSRGMKG
jgi:hypothetical protein